MTQCTYGSQPKAGAASWVWITWTAFLSWLTSHYARLGNLTWLWFPDAPLEVATFCATEIPTPTAPSVAEWATAFLFNPISANIVTNYVTTLFRQSVWATVCECKPVTPGGTCGTTWGASQSFNVTVPTGTAYELGTQFKPLLAGSTFYGVRVWLIDAPPSGILTVDLWDTVTNTNVSSTNWNGVTAGAQDFYLVNAYAGNAVPYALVQNRNYIVAYCKASTIRAYETNAATPPSNSVVSYIDDRYTSPCGSRPTSTFAGWDAINPFVCTGGPPGGSPIPYVPDTPADPTAIPDNPNASCSTTADLCAAIARVMSVAAANFRQTNWIQSAVAPTCWVPGTASTGLTGTGTLAVSDIVGAYVVVTAPATWGRSGETPPRYIPEVGSLSFLTDGAATERYGLHYAAENVLRAVPSTNSIRYNIKSGVTASITPLARCK